MVRGLAWAAGAMLLLGVSGAGAMPVAPNPAGDDAAVTLVRDGCGPSGFRNRYGECRFRGGYGERGYGYRGGYGDRGGYGFRGGYGGGPRFYGSPRFGGGDYGRRCFVRETYDGPRRICR